MKYSIYFHKIRANMEKTALRAVTEEKWQEIKTSLYKEIEEESFELTSSITKAYEIKGLNAPAMVALIENEFKHKHGMEVDSYPFTDDKIKVTISW